MTILYRVGELSLLKNIIQQIETEARFRKEKDARLEKLANFIPDVHKLIEEGKIATSLDFKLKLQNML